MDAAVKGLKLPNSADLREYTYSFFGNVADALKVCWMESHCINVMTRGILRDLSF
jgi:hypothetical protein